MTGVRKWMLSIARQALLLLIAIYILLPIVWVFLGAFKTQVDIFRLTFLFKPTLQNFVIIFRDYGLGTAMRSSLIVSGFSVLIAIPVSVMAAYSFSRFRVFGGQALFFLVLATQFIPAVVIIIPYFLIARDLGLLDTHLALIIVNLSIITPFGVWMLTGFIKAISPEVEEAALVDGSTRWQVVRNIVFPMIMPGILTTAIFCFILSWNEFLFALMISQTDMRTWPIVLALFSDETGVRWEYLCAASMIAMLPVFFLTLSIQKHFVTSMSMGAVR